MVREVMAYLTFQIMIKSFGTVKLPLLYKLNVPLAIISSRNLIELPSFEKATSSFRNTLIPTNLATDRQSSDSTPLNREIFNYLILGREQVKMLLTITNANGQNRYWRMLWIRRRNEK